MSTSDSSSPESPAQPETLTWRVFRAKETPTRTIIVSLFILAILVFVALVYREPLMVFLAILVFALALNSYYLPTRYTLDADGVTIDKYVYRYARRWSEFRSFVRTTGGLVLSPFSNWSYLDNFRGIHLLLPRDPAPVIKYLAGHLPQKKRPSRNAGT